MSYDRYMSDICQIYVILRHMTGNQQFYWFQMWGQPAATPNPGQGPAEYDWQHPSDSESPGGRMGPGRGRGAPGG